MRRRLCAAILSLEAIAFGLVTPVLISIEGTSTAAALAVGLGLLLGCLLVAGLLRFPWAYAVGWALQVAAILTGFVVPTMFFLGAVFLALWATAYLLGQRIETERARWEAEGRRPGSAPSPARAEAQARPRLRPSSIASRAARRSSAGEPASGPLACSVAKPCTAAQQSTSAPGRRSGDTAPATTHSSSTWLSRLVGAGPRVAVRDLGRLGVEPGEGHLEQARSPAARSRRRPARSRAAARRPAPAGSCSAHRVQLALHRLAQPAHRHEGDLGQQVVAVGEVPVRRVVRDAGTPGDLAQHDAVRARRCGPARRRSRSARPQVAVVVGGHEGEPTRMLTLSTSACLSSMLSVSTSA